MMTGKRSSLKAGAVVSYCAIAFNTIAGLLYTPWMIECVGPDDYGLYVLALSVINFFLLDFGLSSSVTRFLSKYQAEGNEHLIPSFLGIVYKTFLAVAAVIALIFIAIFLNIDFLYSNLGTEQLSVFKKLFAIAALYSVIIFPCMPFNGILTSGERYVPLNVCDLLQKVITVALIVVCLLQGAGIYALVFVNAIVSLLFSLIKYLIVRKDGRFKASLGYWDVKFAKQIFGFSAWVMIAQVSQRFIFAVMPSIIAITANSWEVTLFGLASSLEGYVYTASNVLNSMIMPRVSQALASNEKGALQELMTKFGRIQLMISGFIIICFISIGDLFVECWVGDQYSALWACTALLLVPAIVELPQQVANTAMIASGVVKIRGIVYLAMAVVNMIIGVALSQQAGALGACFSICVAYSIRTVGFNCIYKYKLNIQLKEFFKNTYPRWVFVAVVILAFTMTVRYFTPITVSWLTFIVSAFLYFALYGLLLVALVMNDYEKGLIKAMLFSVLNILHKR